MENEFGSLHGIILEEGKRYFSKHFLNGKSGESNSRYSVQPGEEKMEVLCQTAKLETGTDLKELPSLVAVDLKYARSTSTDPSPQLQVNPEDESSPISKSEFDVREILEQNRVADISRTKRQRKKSLWYRIQQKHRTVGLVEVGEDHSAWTEINAFTTAMYNIWNSPIKYAAKNDLLLEDYAEEQHEDFIVPPDRNYKYIRECNFVNYAPAAFATIRRAVSIAELDFFETMISAGKPMMEFVSNSRSGMDFFFSHDMRFLIKTNKEADCMFFLKILGQYVQHFLTYPHSLIVKFLCLCSLQIAGNKKIWILVMQNIFYPADRIEIRYDLKGCLANRYETPDPPGKRTLTVLKDQNFLNEELNLGEENSEWFLKQLEADATFMSSLNCMDYSLLVAKQKLHKDEKQTDIPSLVARITSSGLLPTQSLSANTLSSIKERSIKSRAKSMCNDPEALANYDPGKSQRFPRLSSSRTLDPLQKHRRLLPRCANAIHIIDGPEYRYYLGIVDFLTFWTYRQRFNQIMKLIKHGCGDQSTVPPHEYARRFVDFIADRVV